MDEQKEHENWIRFNCFEQARKMSGNNAKVESVINKAKKIEQYVSGRHSKNVVKLERRK